MTKLANDLRDGDTIETIWGFAATIADVEVKLCPIDNRSWRTFFTFVDPEGVECASSIDRNGS